MAERLWENDRETMANDCRADAKHKTCISV
jgi:hypothetical protein